MRSIKPRALLSPNEMKPDSSVARGLLWAVWGEYVGAYNADLQLIRGWSRLRGCGPHAALTAPLWRSPPARCGHPPPTPCCSNRAAHADGMQASLVVLQHLQEAACTLSVSNARGHGLAACWLARRRGKRSARRGRAGGKEAVTNSMVVGDLGARRRAGGGGAPGADSKQQRSGSTTEGRATKQTSRVGFANTRPARGAGAA